MMCLRHLICGGAAIVQHVLSLQGDLHSRSATEVLEKAASAWEETIAAVKACWPKPGFAELVAVDSLSEVCGRLGRPDVDDLRMRARHVARPTMR